MLKAHYRPYQLHFCQPVLTSRGAMKVKNGYYLMVTDGKKTGIGEGSFIEGLSIDDVATYETALQGLCRAIETDQAILFPDFNRYPSLLFAYQCAMLDFKNRGNKLFFESEFTRGKAAIPINGLVWMGNKDFMLQQIAQKLSDGFSCIKIKVGAIDFEEEVSLLAYLREQYPKEKIEIRLDANGAFTRKDVFGKLETLAQFHIHSIEQPVKPGQVSLMKEICASSLIPIAFDEELIGINHPEAGLELLETVRPQYLILKPSLLGGLQRCDQWILQAEQNDIGWWATSALESNIGLNAIAQWVFTKNIAMVQGLGTGGLYTNNIDSPLTIEQGCLRYRKESTWGKL